MKSILFAAVIFFLVVLIAAGLPGYVHLKNAAPLENSAPPHYAFFVSAMYATVAAGLVILLGFLVSRLR